MVLVDTIASLQPPRLLLALEPQIQGIATNLEHSTHLDFALTPLDGGNSFLA
jgi:hypothetical protein